MTITPRSGDTFDVIVIGAGPAGETCAAALVDGGLHVAVVERELVGGECPYWGCMPSKALLRPAQARSEAQRVAGAAEAVTGGLDVAAVLARRDAVAYGLDDASHAGRLSRRGVEVVRGHARLVGRLAVQVDGSGAPRLLTARRSVVIAAGTRASIPPIPGLRESAPWTNREATLAAPPGSLAIIGGGVIGVELGQAFATLGSRVTVIEAAPRILTNEEPFVSEQVEQALVGAGVDVRCGSPVAAVARREAGVTVTFADGTAVVADEVLVATGRTATTADLGLDSVGVTPGRAGFLATDRCLRVDGSGWLFAIGDANGRALLTHTAVYQGSVAARTILGTVCECLDEVVTAPRVIFTEPQVAAVGHTLASAEAAGIDATAYDRDISRVAGASFHGRGVTSQARFVVDRAREVVVGATFTGADIAEMLQGATVAIVGEVPLERLRHCVPPFPTRNDVWTRLVQQFEHDGLGAGGR